MVSYYKNFRAYFSNVRIASTLLKSCSIQRNLPSNTSSRQWKALKHMKMNGSHLIFVGAAAANEEHVAALQRTKSTVGLA